MAGEIRKKPGTDVGMLCKVLCCIDEPQPGLCLIENTQVSHPVLCATLARVGHISSVHTDPEKADDVPWVSCMSGIYARHAGIELIISGLKGSTAIKCLCQNHLCGHSDDNKRQGSR